MNTHPKRDEAGDGGGGGAAPAATKTEPTQAPAAAPAATTQQPPAQAPSGTPEGFVPSEQLRAVSAERDALKREKEQAEEKRQKDQGEWQTLAEKRESEAKAATERFIAVARRAAFVSAASTGKDRLADPEAGYKLAVSDGLLKDVKIDDDGNADSDAIAKAVKATIDKYDFLKPGSQSFGGDRSAAGAQAPADNGEVTPRERMRRAYETGR